MLCVYTYIKKYKEKINKGKLFSKYLKKCVVV